jgi:hypothetical protein
MLTVVSRALLAGTLSPASVESWCEAGQNAARASCKSSLHRGISKTSREPRKTSCPHAHFRPDITSQHIFILPFHLLVPLSSVAAIQQSPVVFVQPSSNPALTPRLLVR